MLDSFATVAVSMVLVVCLYAFISSMGLQQPMQLLVAAAVGIWIGLVAALGAIGEFVDAGRRPVPLIGIMFVTPLIVIAIIAWLTQSGRRALLSVPLPVLIGLNIPRLLGGSFLWLAAEGRLGGPFPSAAAWGDITTALVAMPIMWLAARANTNTDRLIGAWNIFGALDLFVAVGLATLSTPGSPLQLIQTPVGSAAMQHLPWVMIPTVLVPYWLTAHIIIFAQLRARIASQR